MNEAHRIRIERALQDIDAWCASGMKLSAYALSRGDELSYWRAQLNWERRWRLGFEGDWLASTGGCRLPDNRPTIHPRGHHHGTACAKTQFHHR